ncbi:hypothetical protein ABMA28_005237 [Loxostege sticticalis]|uniref:HTH CENPB-type domain-containing protein n=1 Tax=Loxostege sticticalis TaxID=481309 RepID=A0ABD0SPT2_LOXSC
MSPRKKRGESWSEDDLKAALRAVRKGKLSQRAISLKYKIPRRTLRDHIKTGQDVKRMGRKPILTEDQENDLCGRIKRFAKIGLPLTPKFIRKQAFLFCERFDIKHTFNSTKRIAGADWLRQFMKRNPSISKRKPQILNPARAQKLNKPIVQEHFQNVRKLYEQLDILQHPERLYNMDEKGCRITVHNQHAVLAEKGSKRVHLIAPEHAENVTIAMCVNAIGTAIPPMILFKGQRQRPDLSENLPAGTLVRMAPKGSMTADLFVEFIQHLAKYKVGEKCLLIFDGAKCHLSVEALDAADNNDMVLYCLPSNTTHELQPLDKSVNKSFEHHWDQEVLNYLSASADRTLTKATFNKIFTRVWPKCMTHNNIVNGFKATGLFPFDPQVIPEEAFAPSVLSEIPCAQILSQQNLISNSLDDDTDSDDTYVDHDHHRAEVTELSTFQRKSDLLDKNVNPELKSRLVDYSSSSDNSEMPSIWQNPSSQVMIEVDRESPSLMPDSNSICSSQIDSPHNKDGDKHLGQYDLAVPSCSGLQKPICNDPSSDSTISDLDSFVTRPLFKQSKCIAKNIYDYTSDESSRDGSQCHLNKGTTTPKKQMIRPIQNETCSLDEDNVPLASLQKESKTQFQQFLPTPNYAKNKSSKPRKKAMNYKGQRITKDLFNDKTEIKRTKKQLDSTVNKTNKGQKKLHINKTKKTNDNKEEKINKKKKEDRRKKENKAKDAKNKTKHKKKMNRNDDEAWYCNACGETEELDMAQCILCKRWYHEECVGLSECDIEFICPYC